MSIQANDVLDAKGLACPMPIVKTKKAIKELDPGQVMEVQATDKGSTADLKAWAESTGHQYLGTVEEDDILKHYVRKASVAEAKEEKKYEKIAELSTLQAKYKEGATITVLDVREPAEFAFGHILGAVNIPFGELVERFEELDKKKELYIICRTGSRSDLAAQKLTEAGFTNIWNVVSGMSKWDGPLANER
ncbi:sulfurtransferase TusA family protein [Virgibacillus salarius]|uniref:sulfurtransferase TusA family protein n=1 Tax=Virgibacillus salarius TaxID=447199 RepID=UPI002491AA4E|nr:sulfurtransferase TusA family protein [Virgibacillus salarius]WBX79824.1 sulfurtransferase TusA family protein [Virgibacillus salarius]